MHRKTINLDDYIGKVFGSLTIIHIISSDKYGHIRFLCICTCGTFIKVLKNNLEGGYTKSCGCFRKKTVSERTRQDLVGMFFGRLEVIKALSVTKRRNVLWLCKCSCGNYCETITPYLINGDTKSCGCLKRELVGSASPHWKGGAKGGYCRVWRTKEFKDYVKERDNNKCQNPYCFNSDNVLHIHHIDYDKKNCSPYNLITVCRACNSRANIDRAWHTAWYQTLLHNKYSYVY